MKRLNLFGGFVLTILILASCTTVSKEQKLVQVFELAEGNSAKVENFTTIGNYTFADSVTYWEGILEEKVEAFLIQMDSAEARLDKSTKAAKEGLANNNFPALDEMFESTIKDNKLIQLRIDVNRAEAISSDGGDTPLRGYYKKIEALKAKGEEVIYNRYKAKIVIDGEQISKTYFLNADNTEVVKAITED